MGKPTIYASGNETIKGEFSISYYIIEKDKKFLDWLGKFLEKILEIKEGDNKAKFIFKTEYDENEKPIKDLLYAKEINKMIDFHEHYEDKESRIDIFYGKNRIYLTVRTSREKREKTGDFIIETKDWIKVKEVPEIPEYVNKEKPIQR